MDDQMNQSQGMPGSVPQQPTDLGVGAMGGEMTPPPPPPMGGGMDGGDSHEKILSALTRIEEKLAAIAAKVGA